MSAPDVPAEGRAALALVGVVLCTAAFTAAARRLGLSKLAIGVVLFLAGQAAAL
jgi:hypothetical protein